MCGMSQAADVRHEFDILCKLVGVNKINNVIKYVNK